MSGFLLDTNIPSELTRPNSAPQVVRWLDEANDESLYLSVISLGEILKALRPWFDDRLLPIDAPIAERCGVLSGEYRLRGKQIKVADGLIERRLFITDSLS